MNTEDMTKKTDVVGSCHLGILNLWEGSNKLKVNK